MTKTKSAQPVNAIELANHISSTKVELAAASTDFALLKRLSSAEANVARLTALLADLQDTADTIETNEHEAERQEAFARIRNMSVTPITPSDNPTAGLLATKFAVSYETVSYDSSTRRTVWLVANAPNINYLPTAALAYLTEAKPEIIPAGIMALAPNNPIEAVRSFIQAISRGYVTQ